MLNIQKNVELKNFSTFRIGGPAKFFASVQNEEELVEALKYARDNSLSFFILGGGSNLLFSDDGFSGIVIRLVREELVCHQDFRIEVGAGAGLSEVVKTAQENSLTGMEWAAGIPGTVGGAIRGNAGAFGGSISDSIEKVKCINGKTMEMKIFSKEDCQFNYRSSIFKQEPNLIIISAIFKLAEGKEEDVVKKIKEVSEKRKEVQPKGLSSGSFFKNPIVSDSLLFERFEAEKGIKLEGGTIPAGWLIEKSGLLGKKIGGIGISLKHGNFIVNDGTGTAQDVIMLVSIIKQRVRKVFNIELQEEIQYVGF